MQDTHICTTFASFLQRTTQASPCLCALCVLQRRFLTARRTSAALSMTPLPFHPTHLSLWIFHAPLHTKLPFPERCIYPHSSFFSLQKAALSASHAAVSPKSQKPQCAAAAKAKEASTEHRVTLATRRKRNRRLLSRDSRKCPHSGQLLIFLFCFFFEQKWPHFPPQEGHKKIFGSFISTLTLYSITDSQQSLLQVTSLKPWCVYDLQRKVSACFVERNKKIIWAKSFSGSRKWTSTDVFSFLLLL